MSTLVNFFSSFNFKFFSCANFLLIVFIYALDLMARTEPPAPRMGHSSVVYDRKLWVYGGKGERSNLNDLAVYSFSKNVWLAPQSATGSTPGQRRSHHATVYNNKMYIYGGYFGYNLVTDMFEYDFGIFLFIFY